MNSQVPKWIIEPAMRNAEVKPIEEHEYERRMSQVCIFVTLTILIFFDFFLNLIITYLFFSVGHWC